jgi:hypothetical protein
MSRQALNGKLAGKTNDTAARKSPEDVGAPLDYALSVMHDEAQPTTLRATMARAALPFLHSRRVPMLPMPVEDRRSDFGLRAPHDAPSTAATLTPRRWSEKLQAADARAQASEAEAQRHAALLHAAEERAQVAEIRTRELEKKLLAAQTHARELEQRAQAMEERAMAAEARIARLEKGKARTVNPAQAASRVLDDDALRQLKAVQESLLNAEERARKAEMRAYDMEQRSLAAEAIIAGSR